MVREARSESRTVGMPSRVVSLPAHRAFWRRLRVLYALAAVLMAGCQSSDQPKREPAWFKPLFTFSAHPPESQPASDPAPEPEPTLPPAGPDGSAAQPIIILQTRFDVLRIRVPRGVFSQSGKIWNHVSEEVIPDATARLLQRNGLRVALGHPDSYPPIHAMLENEPGAEMSNTSILLANGLPLTIAVDQHRTRDQTLFLYRADGTMAGVTCPMSTNLIRVEYSISIDTPNAVQVDVMPEIRQQQVRGNLAINELGQLDAPREEPTRVLRELAFRMVVAPEDFVMIGPSPTVWPAHHGGRSYLAGSLLLCETIDGKPYESMYFITPRQERSDRKALGSTSR